jgi:hypothetical protein
VLCFSPIRFPEFAREFFDVFDIPGFTDFATGNLPRLNSGASLEGVTIRKVLAEHLPPIESLKPSQRHDIAILISEIDSKLSRQTSVCTLSPEDRMKVEFANAVDMQAIIARYLQPEHAAFLLTSQSAPGIAKNLNQSVSFNEADLLMIRSKLYQNLKLLSDQCTDSVINKLRANSRSLLDCPCGF